MRKKRDKKLNVVKESIEEMEVYKMLPKDMCSLSYKKPCINLKFDAKGENIDLYSVKMFLNDKTVSAEVSNEGIRYVPRKELKLGCYHIKVVFKKKGESKEVNWRFTITDGDIKYKLYYGIPHSHTSYSGGEGVPAEAYKNSKDKELDFLIITEHWRALNGKVSNKVSLKNLNHLKHINDLDKWDVLNYEKDALEKKEKKFLPLCGFELSTRFFGHINIYNIKDYRDVKFKNYNNFYEWLKSKKDIIISFNHPRKDIGEIPYSSGLNEYIKFVEIGNGSPPFKYMRTEGVYFNLLDRGWHLGVLNSQDNHKKNWGEEENLTVILCEKLNKKNFFEALLSRRTYSTESRTLKIKFKAKEQWMGSIINCEIGENIKFTIEAEDKKKIIKKVQVITNGGQVFMEKEFNCNFIKWSPTFKLEKDNSWYVVKVILEGDKWGITSAIFL